MEAPLCESICVQYLGDWLLLEPRSRMIIAVFCSLHLYTAWYDATSVHCAELCHPTIFCSSAKLTSAIAGYLFARFGIISENRVVISRRSEAKNLYTVECLLAAFRKPETQNTGAEFNASHSLCNILQLSRVNRMARAAF